MLAGCAVGAGGTAGVGWIAGGRGVNIDVGGESADPLGLFGLSLGAEVARPG